MTPEQEQLVVEHIGLARRIAAMRNRDVPAVWRGDIASAALEGLMSAAARFDPDSGWKFSTFAGWRINGAITDEIRHLYAGRTTPAGNNWRNRTRDMSIDAMAEAEYSQHGDQPDMSRMAILADPDSDPADRYEQAQDAWCAADLVAMIEPEHDRQVAELYFFDGLTLAA